MLGVNLTGVIYTAQAAVPHLWPTEAAPSSPPVGRVVPGLPRHLVLQRHQGRRERPRPRLALTWVPSAFVSTGRPDARYVAQLPDAGWSPVVASPTSRSPARVLPRSPILPGSTARRTSSTMPRSRSSWPRTTRRTCPARWSTWPTAAPRRVGIWSRGPRPAQPQRLNPRGSPSPVSSAQQVRNTHDDSSNARVRM